MQFNEYLTKREREEQKNQTNYWNVGHGENKSKVYVWFYDQYEGNFEVSEPMEWQMARHMGHSNIFNPDFDRDIDWHSIYAGRYEVDTKTLSI